MIARYGLMDDEDIELDVAALELSELDHEGTDLTPYVATLQEIADRLAEVGEEAETSVEQARALAKVIGDEFGFAGDSASYDAPLNADFIRVIDRRQGLPVSLSILYVAAARRMGWTAHALNTPAHVLVSIGEDMAVIVDPFNKGRVVSPSSFGALLERAWGDDDAEPQRIAPMTNRAVLVRLLLNQALRAEQAGDVKRSLAIYERMTIVAPDNPDGWWQLARLQIQDCAIEAARHSLSSMLEVTRDADRRELATATLDSIADR